MKEISKCFLICSFLFFHLFNCIAQEDSLSTEQESRFRYQGLRIGVDLGEILVNSTMDDRFGFTVLADYEFKEDKFATFELGAFDFKNSGDSVNYSSKGSFGLIGIDFNIYDKGYRINDDMLFFGLRYGFSSFTQSVDNYSVTNYWGTFESSIDNEAVTAHWFEFVVGGKAEIWFFKNAFLSLHFRPKYLVYKTKDTYISPEYIPGFGKSTKKFGFDINWTLSYRIPFKKVKVKSDEEIEKIKEKKRKKNTTNKSNKTNTTNKKNN